MTFPKRGTRTITVDGDTYKWHLHNNDGWAPNRHIAVQHESGYGQLLLLDHYSWHMEVRPRTIREAISYGLANGWAPLSAGEPMKVSYDESGPHLIEDSGKGKG